MTKEITAKSLVKVDGTNWHSNVARNRGSILCLHRSFSHFLLRFRIPKVHVQLIIVNRKELHLPEKCQMASLSAEITMTFSRAWPSHVMIKAVKTRILILSSIPMLYHKIFIFPAKKAAIQTKSTRPPLTDRRATQANTMAEVRGPRIPMALQQVFLASNRGKEVNKPPPGGVAVKVFKRTWFWQKKSSITRSGSSSHSKKDKDKKSRNPLSRKKKDPSKHSDKKKKKKKDSSSNESPQIYLCAILESRGYSLEEFNALETGYHNTPTAFQTASYGSEIIDAVKRGDEEELRNFVSCGLSPNACNEHGESLIHMACRKGESSCLNVLVEYGATLQVADDYGRTPLHDACWAPEPNFEIVEVLLQKDVRMLNLLDGRKQTPLSYVRREIWKPWKKFLHSKIDQYWPQRDVAIEGPEAPPELVQQEPNSRKIPVPKEALPLELASMVAQGKMDPAEAQFLRHIDDDDNTSSSSEEEGTQDDSSDSDESDSDFSFDEDEMAEILQSCGGFRAEF
jgi:ankyrin repeat protein